MSPTKSPPPKPPRKKIFVVDDHPIMRQGLVQLIDNEPDLKVVGEAETATEAFGKIQEQAPELVLLDITLPGKNGLELIKDLQSVLPELPILVLSMHDESLYAERVLRAGGRGYLMKQEGGKKLIQGIRQVLGGQIYVSEKISAKILEFFSGGKKESGKSAVERLTDREFEVFQMVGQGKGTREIAKQLNLSVKTVEVHRAKIKEKLGLQSSPELIRYAVRWVEGESAS